MAIDDTIQFTFVSNGLPEDTFSMVKFNGTEGISRLYEFDITLVSDDPNIDLKEVLQHTASLTIHGDDQAFPIHGILSQFEQLHEVHGHYFYRALLVPRLWQADLYRENQLFLDKTVPNILEEILKQTGLTTRDYELKLTKIYPRWEYICQYRETDFDFISRWMEREGIYYFFEQGQDNEKLIITDRLAAHKDIPGEKIVPYSPPSGLVAEKEAIQAFICRQKRLPNKVILKDYNYRKPSLDLKATAVVDEKGRGNVYFYGEHFKTPEEGTELAKIRAQEIRCRENVFHGEGSRTTLFPGFIFKMSGHYRESYNRNYLVVEIEHQGRPTGAFWTGTGDEQTEAQQQPTYANAFMAIPSDVQFRPARKTPKTRFYGTMNAKVDASGISQYADIDDQGRYKVKLPFDQDGNEGGKASRWVRMVQPYAGADHGMHFPLHKDTEVLLTFVDGDPDRPIIAGAVPNTETRSVVTSLNATRNTIKSAGGNLLEMQDMAGKQRILLSSPHENTYLHMGAPNSPTHQWVQSTKGSTLIRADKNLYMEVGKNNGAYNYEKTVESTGKLTEDICQGKYNKTVKNTGTLTETICDPNYERTVDQTGTLSEKICTDKYHRQIDPSGNLTETVNGTLTLHSHGNMLLKTDDGEIEINAANQNKNVIIKANRREEFTNSEWEVNHLGNKFQLTGGAQEEIACGGKVEVFGGGKFESLNALAISLALAGNFGFNFGLEIQKSLINIISDKISIKKKQTKIENSGVAVTVQNAIKMIL